MTYLILHVFNLQPNIKGALCGFGKWIQTQKGHIYSTNDLVRIHTHFNLMSIFPQLKKPAALRGRKGPQKMRPRGSCKYKHSKYAWHWAFTCWFSLFSHETQSPELEGHFGCSGIKVAFAWISSDHLNYPSHYSHTAQTHNSCVLGLCLHLTCNSQLLCEIKEA